MNSTKKQEQQKHWPYSHLCSPPPPPDPDSKKLYSDTQDSYPQTCSELLILLNSNLLMCLKCFSKTETELSLMHSSPSKAAFESARVVVVEAFSFDIWHDKIRYMACYDRSFCFQILTNQKNLPFDPERSIVM